MSLPTNFFIARGGGPPPVPYVYQVLLIGGGGGCSTSYNGAGGMGAVAVLQFTALTNTAVNITAGGAGASSTARGGGGGHSRIEIPSYGYDAVVGGGGGSGYWDLGGFGGGVNKDGTSGWDYPGQQANNGSNLYSGNSGSGNGGSLFNGAGSGGTAPAGSSGGQFYGGVYQPQSDFYSGGGGGSGYYGGGSGCGNNGWGGGAGGGGCGYLNTGSIGTLGTHSILLNTDPIGTNGNIMDWDRNTVISTNPSLGANYGTVRFEHPTNSFANEAYMKNPEHSQIANNHSHFGLSANYGYGAKGGSYGSGSSTAGVVHIYNMTTNTNIGGIAGGNNAMDTSVGANATQTIVLS